MGHVPMTHQYKILVLCLLTPEIYLFYNFLILNTFDMLDLLISLYFPPLLKQNVDLSVNTQCYQHLIAYGLIIKLGGNFNKGINPFITGIMSF